MGAAFVLSAGQPWLVNALARECVSNPAADGTRPVTGDHIGAAADALVARMDTHLDSLAERLREPRVRSVIEPMLAGGELGPILDDDLRFVIDLGLVRYSSAGGIQIHNPIYAQVVPRALASIARASLPATRPTWIAADGSLSPIRLLEAFLLFWRQHGRSLLASAPYAEVAAQLVMMAFLDRVANGGGRIEREYAIGKGRIDLCLMYGKQRIAMELRSWRAGQQDPTVDGLVQLDGYLDGLSVESGWLVVFDQRDAAVSPRAAAEIRHTASGREITVVWV